MTGETMRSRNAAGHTGFVNNLLAFIGAIVSFAEGRFALFARESKTAFGQIVGLLACVVGALMFLAMGYVFLIVSAIVGIAHLAQVSWIWVALAGALLHFVLVLAFLLGARSLIRKPMFREFASELKKDREWIKNLDRATRPMD